jgi:hypothetical protein
MRRCAVAGAIALGLVACTADDLLPAGTPHDATAVFRPASMVADRETAAPGDMVGLSFPDEMTRGVMFVLEEEGDSSWTYRYFLVSSTSRAVACRAGILRTTRSQFPTSGSAVPVRIAS